MDSDYQFMNLSDDDLAQIRAFERDLADKYHRDIVLIAYEKPGEKARQSPIDREKRGRNTPERGATFGVTHAHGDHHPTLASVMGKDLAGGEDLRFGDVEPPKQDG